MDFFVFFWRTLYLARLLANTKWYLWLKFRWHILAYSDVKCRGHVTSSSSALPYVTWRIKSVSGLSTPTTGRTSLTVFLSRIGIVGIGKSLNVLWFHSRCLHGENYCILEMIRHISPWQGLIVTLLTVFLLNLVWCLMDTHLLTSLGWLSSLSMSAVQSADCLGRALVSWTCTRGPLNVL